MTTRDVLHQLVDMLPENELPEAERLLAGLQIAGDKRTGRYAETAVDRLDRVRAQIMHGRTFEDDSTEILRCTRAERSAL